MRLSDAVELAVGLDRLALWLRRQTPQLVSSSTVTALDRLATEGPLRVSDLAAREAMTQPGVTLLVNRMAGAGYAERVPDPTDGRAALVRITDAGRALLAERNAARAAVLRERLTQLGAGDQHRLAAALPALERLVGIPTDQRKPAS
jgi:DNA-binding MarR family transcriptional regulator